MEYAESIKRTAEKIMMDEDIGLKVLIMKDRLKTSGEPYLFQDLDIEKYRSDLPSNIETIRLYILKENTPSIEHYHPNSIQHTIIAEGGGTVKIDGMERDLKELELIIIPEKVPHEFFPGPEKVVLFSFHTCESEDLIELRVK
ncbi:MAG TPA: cupin domain-containing protein [Firmicutes bacterium]|nr:cupin domain-containing protein [Bacillota bacterium]